jgi:hypothetical protein
MTTARAPKATILSTAFTVLILKVAFFVVVNVWLSRLQCGANRGFPCVLPIGHEGDRRSR